MGGIFVLYILLDPTVYGSIDTKVVTSYYTPGIPARKSLHCGGNLVLYPWDPTPALYGSIDWHLRTTPLGPHLARKYRHSYDDPVCT